MPHRSIGSARDYHVPFASLAAYQLAGLRRERNQTSGPDGPALGGQRRPLPGRTVPAQVQFAAPLHTVCGTDRRSASVTCLVHSASSAFR